MRASFNVVALALLCAMAAVHVAQASNIQITYQVFANTTTCEGTPFYTYGPYESMLLVRATRGTVLWDPDCTA